MILQVSESEPFQAQVRSLYSVWSVYTNICLYLCKSKRCRPDEASEVCRVGRCSILQKQKKKQKKKKVDGRLIYSHQDRTEKKCTKLTPSCTDPVPHVTFGLLLLPAN